MAKRVILICGEKGCPRAAMDTISEMNIIEPLEDVSILKVIDHPPMQYCEHGGADKESDEHALEEANRKKRESWLDHEKELHGKEVSAIVERLKVDGVKKVRVKFSEKEIGFSNSVINELEDNSYQVAVMSQKTMDKIEEKKIPEDIEVITI